MQSMPEKDHKKRCWYDDLLFFKNQKCEVSSGIPLKGGQEVVMSTKADLLQSILSQLPDMAPHTFVLQKNYLVCQKCGA